MQRARLEAALACLRRLAPEAAERAELVGIEGKRFRVVSLRDAARDDHASPAMLETAADPGRGLALLAMIPREEAQRALAELPQRDLDAWLGRLPLAQAQGFGLIAAASPGDGLWISAPIPDSRQVLSLLLAAEVPEEEGNLLARDLTEAARLAAGSATTSAMSIAARHPPAAEVSSGLRCLHAAGALLGEGPVWNPNSCTLDWVDVLRPAVWSHDPASGTSTRWPVPRLATAVLPASDGSRLVLGMGGLSRLDEATGQLEVLLNPEAGRPTHRFNDAKCDSRGRIWAGSMRLDASASDGTLFRFDTQSSACPVDTGFRVSNGIGWSPDGRTMYFVDTGTSTVFAYDVDPTTGEAGARRPFLQIPADRGSPDGLTVDSEGCVWVALWDGWRVARYTPEGQLDREIILPVPRPTSCCFGGEGLRTLFITSARIRLSREILDMAPLSGALFAIVMDSPGLATNLAQL